MTQQQQQSKSDLRPNCHPLGSNTRKQRSHGRPEHPHEREVAVPLEQPRERRELHLKRNNLSRPYKIIWSARQKRRRGSPMSRAAGTPIGGDQEPSRLL